MTTEQRILTSEAVIKCYTENKMSGLAIAEYFGVNKNKIYDILNNHGYGKAIDKLVSSGIAQKIIDLHKAGLTQTHISDQVQVGIRVVRIILRRNGFSGNRGGKRLKSLNAHSMSLPQHSLLSVATLQSAITNLSNELLTTAALLEESLKGLDSLALLEKCLDQSSTLLKKYEDLKIEKGNLVSRLASRAQVVFGEKSLND